MNLSVDWDFEPDFDKRRFQRMSESEIVRMMHDTREIVVIIIDNSNQLHGKLIDLSASGICVLMDKSISQEYVRVIFFLGNKRIKVKGKVIRTEKSLNNSTKNGIVFIDLDNNSFEFLNSLYASKVLERAR